MIRENNESIMSNRVLHTYTFLYSKFKTFYSYIL